MLDWDDLRFFLAVARHKTMSEAARRLGVAQTTVGRRIGSFEERLGSRLFLRSPDADGWGLSPVGRDVLAHAEGMEAEALAAQQLASGRDAGVGGEVRVTASEWVIAWALGPRVARLLSHHPALSVDLIAEPRHLNLFRGEADVAIRPSRFLQQEIVQRELAVVQFGLYASADYIVRHGVPDFAGGARGHQLIAGSDQLGDIADREWLPPLVGHARVVARSNGRLAMAALASAGVGLACLPRAVGDGTRSLQLVPTPTPGPRRQLWLGVHRNTRDVRRVKAVSDFITAAFVELRPALDPEC